MLCRFQLEVAIIFSDFDKLKGNAAHHVFCVAVAFCSVTEVYACTAVVHGPFDGFTLSSMIDRRECVF